MKQSKHKPAVRDNPLCYSLERRHQLFRYGGVNTDRNKRACMVGAAHLLGCRDSFKMVIQELDRCCGRNYHSRYNNMIRRMSGHQPGFMTLGKNKAKIFYQPAEGILKQLGDILDRGARMLLENEKIEGNELLGLLTEARDYFSKKAESTKAII